MASLGPETALLLKPVLQLGIIHVSKYKDALEEGDLRVWVPEVWYRVDFLLYDAQKTRKY